jgi:polysaccharide pyruvyl transferase WcaK-like protein
MIIEIKGAGFVNKGAELMLLAVMDKISSSIENVKFTLVPGNGCPYEKYARLGIYPKASLNKFSIQWGAFAEFIPAKLRSRYGLITDSEVDIILDISGFAYSDQWGDKSSLVMANAVKRWKKDGKKIIMLPQAFGPFSTTSIKTSIKTIAEKSDLVFARDKESYANITDLTGELPHIKSAPDFTNLLEGKVPSHFDSTNKFCIIPNYRMIDKTSGEAGKNYLKFLADTTSYLLENNCQVFILIHSIEKDLRLAEEINETVNHKIETVVEEDPIFIKGIIGNSQAVISSRFHGLVNALSQGVPALATGWSHKYQMLLEDYNFTEGLLSVDDSPEKLKSSLDMIIKPETRRNIAETIKESSKIQKESVLKMWDEVLKVIKVKQQI